MRFETTTPEEALEAYGQIIEAGFFPMAEKFDAKLVVKSGRVGVRENLEKDADYYGGRRPMIVDYMTGSDDTMEFFEERGIDIEEVLL